MGRGPADESQPAREREFGVPVPGRILPPAQWTKTALKRLPPAGPLDWGAMFGREAPRVLDLGCGNGRSTLGLAIRRPHMDHLGIDPLPVVIRYATRRANQRGLSNVRFAVAEAERILAEYVAPGTLTEVHLYHPQPYREARDAHRRLITPQFLGRLQQALVPQGTLYLQTDNAGYWRYLVQVLPYYFEFEPRLGPWPEDPRGRTRREIIALRHGLTIFRGVARRRNDVDAARAEALAEQLPPPVFDREVRWPELERWE